MTATVFHTRQDAQDPQLTERKNDMATKQAQELVAGDVMDIDGHTLTVHHLFGFMGLVGIAWTNRAYDSVVREPDEPVTVTRVNTAGGAR